MTYSHKPFYTPVKSLFNIPWEKAGGKLIILPVISNALAAIALSWARLVSAVTALQVFFLYTTPHFQTPGILSLHLKHLPFFNLLNSKPK